MADVVIVNGRDGVVSLSIPAGAAHLDDRFAVNRLIDELGAARDRIWPNSAPAERVRATGDPCRTPRGMGI